MGTPPGRYDTLGPVTVLPQVSLQDRELARLRLQARLDAGRTRELRNQLGQYATPPALAADVARLVRDLTPPDGPVRFLEPAMGTGSLCSALLEVLPEGTHGVGYELDALLASSARTLWEGAALEVRTGDFTELESPESFDLLVSNPPYVRHHHLVPYEKRRLRSLAEARTGIRPSGYTGLYGYFLLLAHTWVRPGGLSVWLIPSEFLDVGYGRELKRYLTGQVTLLRVHRFDPHDGQFDDALVSSAVVVFRVEPPAAGHGVRFTSGGSLSAPAGEVVVPLDDLRDRPKWSRWLQAFSEVLPATTTRLGDLFDIRRGAATGDNKFFVLTREQAQALDLPPRFLRPLLPSPRHLGTDEVRAGPDGEPLLPSPLYLLDCDLKPEVVRQEHPTLWAYLQKGVAWGVSARYLCASRSPWYRQEHRPPPPFLCTYMGRGEGEKNPFRFILNESQATATNSYLLLYPKGPLRRRLAERPELRREVWQALNALGPALLKGEGRVYGGGLHKLEPRELANAPVAALQALLEAAPEMALLPW